MTNQQLKAHCEDVIANPQDHLDWVVDMARVALASPEAEPVYQFIVNNPDHDGYIEWADCNADYYSKEPSDSRRLLYTAPPAAGLKLPDEDYFSRLVAAARERAERAMRKFPQPNYVLNKVAEESGEVIKAVIHYTEGREDWLSVEGELIDNLAMLIRLVKEGDQVIGFNLPDEVKRLNAPHTAPIEPICATGGAEWVKVSDEMPLDFSDEHISEVEVIVTDGTTVGTCECRRGYMPRPYVEWSNYGDIDAEKITHWMPLPAAPIS